LKHIIFSILFVVFSIYVAFLNPHESTFHLTQNQTFKLPTVILLLAAAFTGVLISVAKTHCLVGNQTSRKAEAKKDKDELKAYIKNPKISFSVEDWIRPSL